MHLYNKEVVTKAYSFYDFKILLRNRDLNNDQGSPVPIRFLVSTASFFHTFQKEFICCVLWMHMYGSLVVTLLQVHT